MDPHEAAAHKFHYLFNVRLYHRATSGEGIAYCNALLDDAMVICGSPLVAPSGREWSVEARDFLALFTQDW